jgi:COMM domain containing 3
LTFPHFNSSNFPPALPARSEIYDSSSGLEAKQADFAISALLLLAAKHSIDSLTLRDLLNHHKLNNQTIEQLIESYDKFHDQISSKLSKLGNSHNIPHLSSAAVEVQQTPSNEITYKINLQSFDHQAGQSKVIQEMFCNQEELQMLINKLKDIERHCERISK